MVRRRGSDRLGLGIDVANIIGDALLFFFEALDALDQEAQAVVGGSGHMLAPAVR